MPLTIFPLASPPADISTLLKHITSRFTPVPLVNMVTAHICREPCADEFDSLGGHVRKVSQLEAVVIGICGVVVRRADGVCCANIGFGRAWTCEDGGQPARWRAAWTVYRQCVLGSVRLSLAEHVEVRAHHSSKRRPYYWRLVPDVRLWMRALWLRC